MKTGTVYCFGSDSLSRSDFMRRDRLVFGVPATVVGPFRPLYFKRRGVIYWNDVSRHELDVAGAVRSAAERETNHVHRPSGQP